MVSHINNRYNLNDATRTQANAAQVYSSILSLQSGAVTLLYPCSHESIFSLALFEVQFDQWAQLLEEGVSLRPGYGACSFGPGILITQLGRPVRHCMKYEK